MQRSFEVLDSADSGNLPGVPSLLEPVCRVLCSLYFSNTLPCEQSLKWNSIRAEECEAGVEVE